MAMRCAMATPTPTPRDGDDATMRRRGRARDRPWHKTYLDRRAHASKAQRRAMRELYGAHGVTFDARDARRARAARDDATPSTSTTPSPASRVDDRGRTLWSRLDYDAMFDARDDARRVLEIGFGAGENLVATARALDDHVFVGCEVYRPGVARALVAIDEHALGDRVKVTRTDGLWALDAFAPAASLDEVVCHFPDPWRGARKAHRRLVNPWLFVLLERALRRGGRLSVATDDAEYAAHATRVFRDFAAPRGWVACDAFARFDSAYAVKARDAGRACVDLGFRAPDARPA